MRQVLPHLGQGWRFPVSPPEGALEYRSGAEKIRESIWLILDTDPGERVMRPSFGCGLRRYLMKPNSAGTRALIQRDVQLALTTWEPRIQLSDVRVEPGEDPAMVSIHVAYTQVRDAKPGNLVYPFYLEGP